MMLTWRHTAPRATAPFRRLLGLGRIGARRTMPIALCAQRYGFAPWRFRHHGSLYQVCRVAHVRDEQARGGRPPQRYFIVECADARHYTLFQDLQSGTWHIEQRGRPR
jgi:hypothetical protein